MRLVKMLSSALHIQRLYEFLDQRPHDSAISHTDMPTLPEHTSFVANHPYRDWLMIEHDGEIVGSLYVSTLNEIGVDILAAHQRRGLASEAIREYMATHEPLPAVPAVRSGRWLANIAPGNDMSKALFRKLGFHIVQETYAHD